MDLPMKNMVSILFYMVVKRKNILFIDLANYYENRSGTDLPDPGLFLTCYTFSAALLIFLHCEGKVDKVE